MKDQINTILNDIFRHPIDDVLEDHLGLVMEDHVVEQPIIDCIYQQKEIDSLDNISPEGTIAALNYLLKLLDEY